MQNAVVSWNKIYSVWLLAYDDQAVVEEYRIPINAAEHQNAH
jgi:hypothetical protein